jgi:uncharacterized protein YlzI (FlbEa/FlbD family)
MITLHRLGHPDEPIYVNHDMIVSVEANPDTVINLRGGDKIVVADSPQAVVGKVRQCRAEAISLAMLLVNESDEANGAPPVTRLRPIP